MKTLEKKDRMVCNKSVDEEIVSDCAEYSEYLDMYTCRYCGAFLSWRSGGSVDHRKHWPECIVLLALRTGPYLTRESLRNEWTDILPRKMDTQ